jgi:hypothetical protein
LVNEVITKRLPALNDIRKGLCEVKWKSLCLFEHHVPGKDLKRHLVFEDSLDNKSTQAKLWFNQYIDELDQRGKLEELHKSYSHTWYSNTQNNGHSEKVFILIQCFD